MVNEAFVKRFFKPGEEPLGAHFGLDLPKYSTTFEIVGVVRNAKYTDPANTEPPRPLFFVPLAQRVHYDDPHDAVHRRQHALHRRRGSAICTAAWKAWSRRSATFSATSIPTSRCWISRALQDQVDANFDQQRAVAQMTGLFGILALLLAAVGLYGVTAYTVERRTSEIGVRMALGANRMNVVRLVLRGAFLQILIGLLIGIPISIGVLAADLRAALSGEGMGPAGAGRIDSRAQRLRLVRQHHSGAAGGFHQPGKGAAHGIVQSTRRNLEGRGSVLRRPCLRHLCLLLTVSLALPALAQYSAEKPLGASAQSTPSFLKHAGIDQRLGTQIPLSLHFRDAAGTDAPLGQYFGKKPVALAMVYYKCAMLCPQVLHGLATSLSQTGYAPARDYDVVVASIDPTDTPADAAAARQKFVTQLGGNVPAGQCAFPYRPAAGDHRAGQRASAFTTCGSRVRTAR